MCEQKKKSEWKSEWLSEKEGKKLLFIAASPRQKAHRAVMASAAWGRKGVLWGLSLCMCVGVCVFECEFKGEERSGGGMHQ